MLMELTPLGWIVVPILAVVGLLMALGVTMMMMGTKLVRIVAGSAMPMAGGTLSRPPVASSANTSINLRTCLSMCCWPSSASRFSSSD